MKFNGRSSSPWANAVALALLAVVACAFATLQHGDWWIATPNAARWMQALATVAAYLCFCGILWWRTRARHPVDEQAPTTEQPAVLVAYASQTGFAQQLAERSAESLRDCGLSVKLRNIADVDEALLISTGRALFIASTTGEGDPPDPALGFVRDVMGNSLSLGQLQYAVLALGDREYEDFCAFGHQLDNWLRQRGAQPLFDVVEVDNADESALRHWQHHLGRLGGVTDLPDWSPPRYEQWTLIERHHANPGSVGDSAFRLSIAPPAGTTPHWFAGDIAEIGPRHSAATVAALLSDSGMRSDTHVMEAGELQTLASMLARSHLPAAEAMRGLDAQAIADDLKPLPHREYSIASLPADGSVQLLVRRMLRHEGTPGLGSGWLCDYAQPGDSIALRLRSNANFHATAIGKPMILVGNGTGVAGLRAHLKQRIASGARRNWLLFGERNADRDFFYRDEIRHWHAQGDVEHVDLAFSRDQAERVYVQHKLHEQADRLRQWLDEGASLFVCGSLHGMAPGVDAVLRQEIGDSAVETLLLEGRYRRDVY